MERQLWKKIVSVLNEICKLKGNGVFTFSDSVIVKVWIWAVLHDRPISWACQRCNWTIWERHMKLPSNTTMSRRLRSKRVLVLLEKLEERVMRSDEDGSLFWMIDGKPLVISGCSKDKQAGYGRATGGKAKGYKMHVIVGGNGTVPAWRLAPMNKDERVMAARMLKNVDISGYLLADGNYDSNKLHQQCEDKGNLQLVSPRRGGSKTRLGHRKQTKGRLRSKAILEDKPTTFGEQLMINRVAIERFFGNLTNCATGLISLPAWVRTHRRVHRWVQAKMIIYAMKHIAPKTTYVV